ncbi:unnamed protein product [Schistocephalus solidus]|uniref:Secreted protein n=1 Tax=Schistocephalus solidus TaxID=70667 RepID=A0A183TBQ4_SCHSO|nr:unnamed protein product [Schistocephalus solidus]
MAAGRTGGAVRLLILGTAAAAAPPPPPPPALPLPIAVPSSWELVARLRLSPLLRFTLRYGQYPRSRNRSEPGLHPHTMSATNQDARGGDPSARRDNRLDSSPDTHAHAQTPDPESHRIPSPSLPARPPPPLTTTRRQASQRPPHLKKR